MVRTVQISSGDGVCELSPLALSIASAKRYKEKKCKEAPCRNMVSSFVFRGVRRVAILSAMAHEYMAISSLLIQLCRIARSVNISMRFSFVVSWGLTESDKSEDGIIEKSILKTRVLPRISLIIVPVRVFCNTYERCCCHYYVHHLFFIIVSIYSEETIIRVKVHADSIVVSFHKRINKSIIYCGCIWSEAF